MQATHDKYQIHDGIITTRHKYYPKNKASSQARLYTFSISDFHNKSHESYYDTDRGYY
jgi:hypothetical protein